LSLFLHNVGIGDGEGEGGIEMTGSMQLIHEFCGVLISPEKVTWTRIVCLHGLEHFLRFYLQYVSMVWNIFLDSTYKDSKERL